MQNQSVERRREGGSDVGTRICYLLIGGGIGAMLALLFAPKSGQELRGDIADVTRKGIDRTRETASTGVGFSSTAVPPVRAAAARAPVTSCS